ncbi:hypothetical protein JQC91_15960 [Jannaschia sp. Os4]|uniref:hypothetical protein n=1 Tax=Jannaschia sp. Os4 TaxID=2807617 RepID=UPI001939802C|nr:hypothetical protein [Jannaschia sp. Os4]MBM2577802.1 hypothetical protein [Jannaschia sp. Os4]
MLKNFIASESGAVTVDWVVLTAALVGLGLAVMGVVSTGVQNASNAIANELNTVSTNSGFLNDADGNAVGFNNNASTIADD